MIECHNFVDREIYITPDGFRVIREQVEGTEEKYAYLGVVQTLVPPTTSAPPGYFNVCFIDIFDNSRRLYLAMNQEDLKRIERDAARMYA